MLVRVGQVGWVLLIAQAGWPSWLELIPTGQVADSVRTGVGSEILELVVSAIGVNARSQAGPD